MVFTLHVDAIRLSSTFSGEEVSDALYAATSLAGEDVTVEVYHMDGTMECLSVDEFVEQTEHWTRDDDPEV